MYSSRIKLLTLLLPTKIWC